MNWKNLIDEMKNFGKLSLKIAAVEIARGIVAYPFIDLGIRNQYREFFEYEGQRMIISPKERNGFTLYYDLNNPLAYNSLIDKNGDGESDHYMSATTVGISPWALVPIYNNREPTEQEKELFRNIVAKYKDSRNLQREY